MRGMAWRCRGTPILSYCLWNRAGASVLPRGSRLALTSPSLDRSLEVLVGGDGLDGFDESMCNDGNSCIELGKRSEFSGGTGWSTARITGRSLLARSREPPGDRDAPGTRP